MMSSAVLNLPSFASDAQIRERHRALSLIYHPDKQRDEALKEAASAHFLEIQAAYESTFAICFVFVKVVLMLCT